MAQVLLKAEMVRDLPCTEAGQAFFFDTQTQGLGVRVGTKRKAYFAEGRTRGKKRRVTLGSTDALTLAEARKLAKKAIAEMADGVDRNAEIAKAKVKGITLAEAAEAFFESRDLKPKTAYDYEKSLARDFGDWSDNALKAITPALMLTRFEHIRDNSGKAAAALAVRVFRSIWNHTRHATADNEGNPILSESPTNRITALRAMPKPVRRQEHVRDFARFFEALETVKQADFRAFFELALRTGARRSELSNLKQADVDLQRRTFTLRDTKNGTDHTLPMSPQIVGLLEALMERHKGKDYVFGASPYGDPRKSLKAFRAAYGEPLRAHDLRRSFANVAELCDVSETKLKRLLNHANQSVTDGYLVSDNPERLRAEMNRISAEIDRLAGVDSDLHHSAPRPLT